VLIVQICIRLRQLYSRFLQLKVGTLGISCEADIEGARKGGFTQPSAFLPRLSVDLYRFLPHASPGAHLYCQPQPVHRLFTVVGLMSSASAGIWRPGQKTGTASKSRPSRHASPDVKQITTAHPAHSLNWTILLLGCKPGGVATSSLRAIAPSADFSPLAILTPG